MKREEKHGSMKDPNFKSKSPEMKASPSDLRTERRSVYRINAFLNFEVIRHKKKNKRFYEGVVKDLS